MRQDRLVGSEEDLGPRPAVFVVRFQVSVDHVAASRRGDLTFTAVDLPLPTYPPVVTWLVRGLHNQSTPTQSSGQPVGDLCRRHPGGLFDAPGFGLPGPLTALAAVLFLASGVGL